MPKHFRRCAGAVVFNRDKKVLLGSRIDVNNDDWQFPQGGIEDGETPEMAAKRELFEETSVTSVTLVAVDKEPQRYEFTEEIKQKFRQRGIFNDGQDIYFSLFFFEGNDREINLNTAYPEFKDYMWGELDFAVENVIEFKKAVYAQAAKAFEPLIEAYINNLS